MKKWTLKILISILCAFVIFIAPIGLNVVAFGRENEGAFGLTYGEKIETAQKSYVESAQSAVSGERADIVTKQNNYGLLVVKFSDTNQSEDIFTTLKNTYINSAQSVKNYFLQASYNNYQISADFLSDVVVSLDKLQSYFMPRYLYLINGYVEINSNGYDNRYFDQDGQPCLSSKSGAKRHIDRLLREQELVKAVLNAVQNLKNIDVDFDSNGVIDGLNFIFATTDLDLSWDNILWAHRSNLFIRDFDNLKNEYYIPDSTSLDVSQFLPTYLGEKVVDNYTIFPTVQLEKWLVTDLEGNTIYSPGLICHELMHDLGVADYYPYMTSGEDIYSNEPVGELDIMGGVATLPSMPLMYTANRLGWVGDENILTVSKSGTYTLFPTIFENQNKAIKIVLNDYNERGEYFMIEARSNEGDLADCFLTDSGIICYRVNEKNGYIGSDGQIGSVNLGNMYGANEVYVFRMGNEKLCDTSNTLSYAILSGSGLIYDYVNHASVDNRTLGNLDKSAYKSVIDQNTNILTTSIYYQDGTNSGIKISNITKNADGSFTFQITFDDQENAITFADITKDFKGNLCVNWSGGLRNGNATIYVYTAENFTKYKNGEYILNKKITAQNLVDGNMFGESLVYKSVHPGVITTAQLPTFDKMVGVFVEYNGQIAFAGVLNSRQPTFIEYLFGTTTWLTAIIVIIVIFALLIGGAITFIVVKEKHKIKPKEDNLDQLIKEYGDNYWMVDGDAEESSGSDIDGDIESDIDAENNAQNDAENGTENDSESEV